MKVFCALINTINILVSSLQDIFIPCPLLHPQTLMPSVSQMVYITLYAMFFHFCLNFETSVICSLMYVFFYVQQLASFSFFFFYCILGFGVHVQSMQYSCIGTHRAVCFVCFLPFTHIWMGLFVCFSCKSALVLDDSGC